MSLNKFGNFSSFKLLNKDFKNLPPCPSKTPKINLFSPKFSISAICESS